MTGERRLRACKRPVLRLEAAMGSDEHSYSDIEVEVLDDAGVREAVDNALALAECDWEALQQQARMGRFSTETARKAWFVVSSLVEPSPA